MVDIEAKIAGFYDNSVAMAREFVLDGFSVPS